jgi:NAD(P)-dependent dehydrogenase (short-subunit alcohol dehydrogenase family)
MTRLRIVLVTGAGIGRAIAMSFARAGWHVVVPTSCQPEAGPPRRRSSLRAAVRVSRHWLYAPPIRLTPWSPPCSGRRGAGDQAAIGARAGGQ